MGDRGAKVALFDGFARVGRALASGRRIELQVLRRAGLVAARAGLRPEPFYLGLADAGRVRLQPGRAGQQPQRRPGLGAAAAAVRPGGPAGGPGRPAVGPAGPQAPHHRSWRDTGFAVGALLAGLVVAVRMYETHPSAARA